MKIQEKNVFLTVEMDKPSIVSELLEDTLGSRIWRFHRSQRLRNSSQRNLSLWACFSSPPPPLPRNSVFGVKRVLWFSLLVWTEGVIIFHCVFIFLFFYIIYITVFIFFGGKKELFNLFEKSLSICFVLSEGRVLKCKFCEYICELL